MTDQPTDIRKWLVDEADKRGKSASRFRDMSDRVVDDMLETGWRFAKTEAEEAFARAPREKHWTLVSERSEPMKRTLGNVYGSALNATTPFGKYFLRHLTTWIGDPDNKRAPVRKFYRLAMFDPSRLAVYVTNRQGQAYKVTSDDLVLDDYPEASFLDSRRHSKGRPLEIVPDPSRDALREVLAFWRHDRLLDNHIELLHR